MERDKHWGRKMYGKSLVFYFVTFPPKTISQGQMSLSNLVVSILIQRTILRLVGLDLYWALKPSTQTYHSLKHTWLLSINMNLINRASADALITLRGGRWPVFCLFLYSFSLIQNSLSLKLIVVNKHRQNACAFLSLKGKAVQQCKWLFLQARSFIRSCASLVIVNIRR